jgi:hypothetical protein
MSTAQQDKKIVRGIPFPLTCPELGSGFNHSLLKKAQQMKKKSKK